MRRRAQTRLLLDDPERLNDAVARLAPAIRFSPCEPGRPSRVSMRSGDRGNPPSPTSRIDPAAAAVSRGPRRTCHRPPSGDATSIPSAMLRSVSDGARSAMPSYTDGRCVLDHGLGGGEVPAGSVGRQRPCDQRPSSVREHLEPRHERGLPVGIPKLSGTLAGVGKALSFSQRSRRPSAGETTIPLREAVPRRSGACGRRRTIVRRWRPLQLAFCRAVGREHTRCPSGPRVSVRI